MAGDPQWGWWIIWYFFLGGIAAGGYFLAALADLLGSERDRAVARAGYLLAAPLVAVCGVLLIVDLSYPARFGHMLIDGSTWRPQLKFWSPMSVGAWALLLFGMITTVSFAGTLVEMVAPHGARAVVLSRRLHRGFVGRSFDLLGTVCGFFIASYTGVLLTATNQPVWSDSPWLGALFLASASATGLAAIRLVLPWLEPIRWAQIVPARGTVGGETSDESAGPQEKLEALELWVWGLEALAVSFFVGSSGSVVARQLAATPVGWTFLGGALGLGIAVPAVLRWRPRALGRATPQFAAAAVLVGGLLLRYAVLRAPQGL